MSAAALSLISVESPASSSVPSVPRRQPEAYSAPGPFQLPAQAVMQPLATARSYRAFSYWEERLGSEVRRTTLERTFRLTAAVHDGHLVVSYEADPPQLRKPNPSALEQVLLLLAGLYQQLELRLTPTGQLTEVLNQAAVTQTWQRIRQELIQRSGGEDDLTRTLLDGLDAALPRPGYLLASLRYDYLWLLLLGNHYQQQFEHGRRYGQPLAFAQFFPDTTLWFHDQLELTAPTLPGCVAWRCRGTLDTRRTDLPAVCGQLLVALYPEDPDPGTDAATSEAEASDVTAAAAPPRPVFHPAEVRATYDATYELDAATGWPVLLDASVQCGIPGHYSKEYFLRLEYLV